MRMTRFMIVPLLFAFVSAQAGGPKEKPARMKEGPAKEEKAKPDVHPHQRAARQYERQAAHLAEKAAAAPTEEAKADLLAASANYKKLAEMKREALKTENEGKTYDWQAYHKLRGQTDELLGKHKPDAEKPMKPKDAPALKPEMKNMPEKMEPAKGGEKATKMKTASGFEIKTKVGE